jgi:hypothetical protein
MVARRQRPEKGQEGQQDGSGEIWANWGSFERDQPLEFSAFQDGLMDAHIAFITINNFSDGCSSCAVSGQ